MSAAAIAASNSYVRGFIAETVQSINFSGQPNEIVVVLVTPTAPAETPTVEPTAEPTPTPTPTFTPTAAPTSTSTPTKTPTVEPTPIPQSDPWLIDMGMAIVSAPEDESPVEVDFSIRLTKTPDNRAGESAFVEASFDGGASELLYAIPQNMKAGEEVGFAFRRELAPGPHSVLLTVGGLFARTFDFNVEPSNVAAMDGESPTPAGADSDAAQPTSEPSPAPAAAVASPTPVSAVAPTPTVEIPASPTPAPTYTATPTPTAIPQATAAAAPVPTVIIPPSPTAAPTRAATQTPTPAATATPAPTATPRAVNQTPPHLRHLKYKNYAVRLINEQRAGQGLEPVALGTNDAAQMHAEDALANCFSSHWGSNGLKPHMRYTLTGGRQYNSENVSGSNYCIKPSDGYVAVSDVEVEIRKSSDGFFRSPGHRQNILRPQHKNVNIGLAWDRHNFKMVQHFEGDYVEYEKAPSIQGNVLSLKGRVKNGAGIGSEDGLGVQIYYDRPPRRLTLGQLSRTYCYGIGLEVAALREPLTGGWYYPDDEFTTTQTSCPDPYDVSPTAPAPRSHREAGAFWQSAYNTSQASPTRNVTAPWITARTWDASSSNFNVVADIGRVLQKHGPGVYTVVVWADIGGIGEPVSDYAIFYKTDPPRMR